MLDRHSAEQLGAVLTADKDNKGGDRGCQRLESGARHREVCLSRRAGCHRC